LKEVACFQGVVDMIEFPKRLKLHFFKEHDGKAHLISQCYGKACSICSGKLSSNHKILKEVVEYERVRL